MSLVSSLNVGVSALKSYAEGIQVVSNNIANVNTVGYKSSQAQYADNFSNLLRPLVPNQNATAVKIPPTQVGGGVQVESIAAVFSQGTIQTTSTNSDMAIAGNGFFRVRNPQTGQYFVTRAGNFRVDADGYLVTQQGYYVQGAVGASTKVIYDSTTGAYNVMGPQDNASVTVPPGLTKTTIPSAGVVSSTTPGARTELGSYDVELPAANGVQLAATLQVGMPVSGYGIPEGTTVTKIDTITSSPPVITLSNVATQTSSGDGVLLTFNNKTIDSNSLTLTFPADYSRPDAFVGMSLNGAGIPAGTTIQTTVGNYKKTIPASPSSLTLMHVTGTAAAAGSTQTLTVDSTEGLVPGMLLASGNGIPSDTIVTAVDSDGTTFTISNSLTSNLNGASSVVAAGGKTLDPTKNTLNLPDATNIQVGMKVSAEGVGTAYVAQIASSPNYDGTTSVALFAAPPTELDTAASTTSGSATLTLSSATLAASLNVGDALSGDGIPLGTTVLSKNGATITMSNSATATASNSVTVSYGTAVYPSGVSYGSVRCAFGDQTISLNKRPTVDSYDPVTFSLGNNYRTASRVGDLRVNFSFDPVGAYPPDYKFYGTNGAELTGIPLATAKASAPRIRTFNVGGGGDISIVLSNGQTFNCGTVLLQTFKDPGALTREGDNLFSGIETAGPYNGAWVDSNIDRLRPSFGGLGAINGGALELSNVDLGQEFSTMITTQRAFQAGSRVITTTDSMLEETVNLKR
ncbi:MAG: flagellar hook-basal body complex protein [Verrucomicrobia bacterium]|nr:flagellar hook-basal body complex protein [Verrucomicrobiota bacterium]